MAVRRPGLTVGRLFLQSAPATCDCLADKLVQTLMGINARRPSRIPSFMGQRPGTVSIRPNSVAGQPLGAVWARACVAFRRRCSRPGRKRPQGMRRSAFSRTPVLDHPQRLDSSVGDVLRAAPSSMCLRVDVGRQHGRLILAETPVPANEGSKGTLPSGIVVEHALTGESVAHPEGLRSGEDFASGFSSMISDHRFAAGIRGVDPARIIRGRFSM